MTIPLYYSPRYCALSAWVAEQLRDIDTSGLDIRAVCVEDSIDTLPPDVVSVPCMRTADARLVFGADIVEEVRRIATEVRPLGDDPMACSYAMPCEDVSIPQAPDERASEKAAEKFEDVLNRAVASRRLA